MAQRVTHDPTDPAFPHGEPRGYHRGCRCQACRAGKRRADKAAGVRRAQGRLGSGSTIDARPVQRHVQQLLRQVPGASGAAIARASGVSKFAVNTIIAGGKPNVRARTAAALLNTTASDVAVNLGLLPVEEYRTIVRRLQALGYSLAWQAKQLGYPPSTVSPRFMYDSDGGVTPAVAKRVKELVGRIGNQHATPGPDLCSAAISQAKANARSLGYYPPGCYDDDTGELNLRYVPGSLLARADDRAANMIDLLREIVSSDTVTPSQAASRRLDPRSSVKTYLKQWHRLVADLGLQVGTLGAAERRHHVRTLVDAYDNGTADPVYVVLTLGAHDRRGYPKDHPGVQQWEAERTMRRAA